MILKWGAYVHAQDECGIKVEYQSIFDQFNRRIGEFRTYHIMGWIKGTSQSDLTTKLTALEAAYATDYRDLTLYLNNGTTPTVHSLESADCFGGTKVVGFGYMDGPWKMGTEYANRRTFWAIVKGEVRVGDGIYQYREKLEVKGVGGIKWRFIPQINGVAELQTLQTDTPFFYIQQGRAVGFTAYPTPPAALFPSAVHNELISIIYETPEEVRYDGVTQTNLLYPVSWSYVMETTTSQTGVPGPPDIAL